MSDRVADVGRGVSLTYRTYGDPTGEPLLLIAGLGLDLTSWPEGIIDGLARNGFHVVAFDNRDAGASTQIRAPPPSRLRLLLARPRVDAYDLGDMAADTVALLDHLGLERVHLVGMSMGGMIAQTVAARHPYRVASLTSILSTTGDRTVGHPARSTILRLARPPAQTAEQYVKGHLRMLDHIGSASHRYDETRERKWAMSAWHRGSGRSAYRGTARQIGAIQKSGDRTAELRGITAPALVVHGDSDLMVDPSGGRATAAAIPDSRYVVVDGLAHHLPPSLDHSIVELVRHHAGAQQGHR